MFTKAVKLFDGFLPLVAAAHRECDGLDSIFPFHLCHPFLPPFVLLPKGHKLIHVPQPICDASGHRRAHAQCTMNLDEVVSEIIERDGSRVILQLAAESSLCNCEISLPTERILNHVHINFQRVGCDLDAALNTTLDKIRVFLKSAWSV